jgi:hypothetical protein
MEHLNKKKWNLFKIKDIFNVSGTTTTHPSKLIQNEQSKTPRITCSSLNNGLDDTYSNNATENGNVITIDSATVGYISYQVSDFIATDHVEKLSCKHKINRYLGLFLVTAIKNATLNKFNYGYKFSQERIKMQKILSPINDNGEPDYEYMKQYAMSVINKKINVYKKYILSVLEKIEFKEIPKLKEKEWKAFFIGGEQGIFQISSSSSGIDKNKLECSVDALKIPYVTRTDLNNGINDFISDIQKNKYKMDEGNVITIGLDTQTVFYQPYQFYAGQNIQVLRHENLNEFNAEFLVPLIKVQMKKFNWGGNGATLGRLFKTKLMLPIDNNENIDWGFMEQYTMNIIYKKIKQYLGFSGAPNEQYV